MWALPLALLEDHGGVAVRRLKLAARGLGLFQLPVEHYHSSRKEGKGTHTPFVK